MFELPKLVFIILIAGIVWYAMRWFKGITGAPPRRRMPPGGSEQRPRGSGRRIEAEDLVACRVCGAYVAAGAPACGRPDCPQRR